MSKLWNLGGQTKRKKERKDNKTIEENYAKISKEINFELTSLGTPQKKSMLERGIATLYSRMRTMMMFARLHENLKTAH